MVGHGGSSAGSYLADPTSLIPFYSASIVATSNLRVNALVCKLQHYRMHFRMFYIYVQETLASRQPLNEKQSLYSDKSSISKENLNPKVGGLGLPGIAVEAQ